MNPRNPQISILFSQVIDKFHSAMGITLLSASATPCEARLWVRALLTDNTMEDYIVKMAAGPDGLASMQGEFYAMEVMERELRDIIAPAVSGGTSGCPNYHFCITRYLPIRYKLPEPDMFCAQFTRLHRNSFSPDGKWGFRVVSFTGDVLQNGDASDSWETFFAVGFRHMLLAVDRNYGPIAQLEALLPRFFANVIPRLLRPLDMCSKPSLLQEAGKAEVNALYGEPVLFNPLDYHEFNLMKDHSSRALLNTYRAHFPKTAPEEDYDDRIVLYSMRSNLNKANLEPTTQLQQRKQVIAAMTYLVEKYPNGFEGFADA